MMIICVLLEQSLWGDVTLRKTQHLNGKKNGKKIQDSRWKYQEEEAKKLLFNVGISCAHPCGQKEYDMIQEKMYPEYIIKVHAQHKGELLFEHKK